MADIKKAIRVALAQRDMGQVDLARKLQVAQPTVNRWVSGEGDLQMATIEKIAEALDLKPSELMALGEG